MLCWIRVKKQYGTVLSVRAEAVLEKQDVKTSMCGLDYESNAAILPHILIEHVNSRSGFHFGGNPVGKQCLFQRKNASEPFRVTHLLCCCQTATATLRRILYLGEEVKRHHAWLAN